MIHPEPMAWLNDLERRGGKHDIHPADLLHGIELARQMTEERRYGRALRIVQRMAGAFPRDEWLKSLAAEAATLFLTAEPIVSEAEALADQDNHPEAYDRYRKAVKAYDHNPGLWPLVFYFMSSWMLSEGFASDVNSTEFKRLEGLRREAIDQMQRKEERMEFISRLGALVTVRMEEPWPGVVKAFCDSRPTARVAFVDHASSIPVPDRERVELAIGDAIRSTRASSEEWRVQHVATANSDNYVITFKRGDKAGQMTYVRSPNHLEDLEEKVASFIGEKWPAGE